MRIEADFDRDLQFWLLGYEFPATLLVFTTAVLYVVTTEKKGKSAPPLSI